MATTPPLTDERLRWLILFAGMGNLPEWRRGTVKREIAAALTELQAYRAEGMVVVREADLRALVEEYAICYHTNARDKYRTEWLARFGMEVTT